MSRQKAPENETFEQQTERLIFETISNFSNRSEKTSWKRKRDNIANIIEQLKPLEAEILAITAKKLPLMDQIALTRIEMVESCIHPIEDLVLHEGHVRCKFCEKTMSIPKINVPEDE